MAHPSSVKAYGAGLLSSFGELEYCLSSEPQHKPFDPAVVAMTPYPITSYQPTYFVAQSFRDMKEQVREYAYGMKRPFAVRYNGLTQRYHSFPVPLISLVSRFSIQRKR